MADQDAVNDELEDFEGEEQVLPLTILPEDPIPMYDHNWSSQDMHYTALEGVGQMHIRMYHILQMLEAEEPVNRPAIVCLLEAMLKLLADDDTRMSLCEHLEKLDEEGASKDVTGRLIGLMRELAMRGYEDVCLKLAQFYVLGFRVDKDEDTACQVYRMGWTSAEFEIGSRFTIGKVYVEYLKSIKKCRERRAVLQSMCDFDLSQISRRDYDDIYGIVMWAVGELVDILMKDSTEQENARKLVEYWTGVMRNSHKEGEDWDVEHLRLFQCLGKIYEDGSGGQSNLQGAFEAYKFALRNGRHIVFDDIIRVMRALDMDLTWLVGLED